MHRSLLVAILVGVTFAGCLASGPEAPDVAQNRPPEDRDWGMASGDGARVLADLKAFTQLAPRRYDNLLEHDAARDWLVAQWEAAGLNVTRERFLGAAQTTGTVEGQNIVGAWHGTSNVTILIGAHYDSAVTSVEAAYDDGTGTMLVVEMGRAIATRAWNHTIQLVAFDQEEAGLVGSTSMAANWPADRPLALMINLDMVGINWPAGIGGRVNPIPLNFFAGGDSGAANAALWADAVAAAGYPNAASTQTTGLGGGSSDHGPFRNAGFEAAWLRGALIGSYPAYHNVDTVEAMTAIVGGDEANLVAGFQTVLDLTLAFLELVDQRLPAPSNSA